MKVSGFTFIRNAVKYAYPVVESITSVLPLCDEFIVLAGNSDDETLQLIRSIDSPKIKIVHSIWDDSLREGGKVLAVETDKAFKEISDDSDWAFYIQADEVVHEKYHETIKTEMQRWLNNPEVEGLLFKYLHFYGTYNYIGDSRTWYRREIRIIRNDKSIKSYRDAQGFRKQDKPLKVKLIDAYIYHYGWVKHPQEMKQKELSFNRLWHDEAWMKKHVEETEHFDYSKIDSLALFTGTHPKVMENRLNSISWHLDNVKPGRKNFKLKEKLLYWFEQQTGIRPFEYRNYKII